MDISGIVHDLADTIQKEGNARAVYGEPVKLDEHTIVPVAVVTVTVGGGGGAGHGPGGGKAKEEPGGFGGGGTMTVKSIPVGFIHEKDGDVVFHAIDLPGPLTEGDGKPKTVLGQLLATLTDR